MKIKEMTDQQANELQKELGFVVPENREWCDDLTLCNWLSGEMDAVIYYESKWLKFILPLPSWKVGVAVGLIIFALMFSISGCAPTPTPTATVTATAILTGTPIPLKATPSITAASTATHTPVVTATATEEREDVCRACERDVK